MKKMTLLVASLSVVLMSAMLFSATPIGVIPVSAQCPELDLLAEAETYASAGNNPDYGFIQAYDWARSTSGDRWAECGSRGAIIADSSVYVWRDALGNVWGPYPQNPFWNGWGAIGIHASIMYVPPLCHPTLNAYTNGRYYSDGTPIVLDCRLGAGIAYGGRGYMDLVLGITVEDNTGIIYDVAIECWSDAGVPGFSIIQNCGTWPSPWEVICFTDASGKGFIYATMAPFAHTLPVIGCGIATWHVSLTMSSPTLPGGDSAVIDAAEIASSEEEEEEDSLDATLKLEPPVGGVVELPGIEEPGAVSPDSSGHNYGALAGIIVGAVVGVIMLISAAWYIRRRRTRAI